MEAVQNERSGEELCIIALGKTGAGKSHTGNTILQNKDLFETKCSSSSVTKECKSKTAVVNGRAITFVDTPGHFDTSSYENQLKSDLLKGMIECAPRPHAFLIILKVETYTCHEMETVKKITENFQKEVLNYVVVLFTCGDKLDDGKTIEEFVRENSQLKKLVDDCGGRCHVIDNKYWNQQEDGYRSNRVQIEKLLNTIEEIARERGGRCCTNELLQKVQISVQEEIQVVRAESNGRLSEEQIRHEAENRVHSKLLVRLAGVATGALLGSLLGIKELVHFVKKIFFNNTTYSPETLSTAAVALLGSTTTASLVLKTAAVAGGGVLAGAAATGAFIGVRIGYEAVEGEETVLGAIIKTVEACQEKMVITNQFANTQS